MLRLLRKLFRRESPYDSWFRGAFGPPAPVVILDEPGQLSEYAAKVLANIEYQQYRPTR